VSSGAAAAAPRPPPRVRFRPTDRPRQRPGAAARFGVTMPRRAARSAGPSGSSLRCSSTPRDAGSNSSFGFLTKVVGDLRSAPLADSRRGSLTGVGQASVDPNFVRTGGGVGRSTKVQ
jgi:hypothetical protein